MANRQRAEARRKAQAKAARKEGGGGGGLMWLWIGLGLVVAVVGVVVLVTTGGDDKDDEPSASVDAGLDALPDSQPVTITGDPLPTLVADTPADDEAVGMAAPVLEGLNFQDKAVIVDPTTTGRAVMVVFLAHWCPHCNAEIPLLIDWKQTGGVPDELDVIGVATAVSPSAPNYPPAEWFNTRGWQWPVLVDNSPGNGDAGEAARAYGAPGWPYFVIIGADGLVKARYSGEIGLDDLQTLVDAALAG